MKIHLEFILNTKIDPYILGTRKGFTVQQHYHDLEQG